MSGFRNWLLGPQASLFADKVDTLYIVIFWLCMFFFLLITGLTLGSAFAWRYKKGRKTPHITDHLFLELAWSIVPLCSAS